MTYGIDLGTTYSCIAKLDVNGRPIIILNEDDGLNFLASAVYFESPTNTVVGEAAKSYMDTDPGKVVQFIKREIGKPDAIQREFFGETYSPRNISSIVLKRMAGYVKAQTGEDVVDVVITCPAYFRMLEREETRHAAMDVGFNVLSIINEPTAAALNYCAREFQDEATIMVYDLGGGTFDVTIMNMSERDDGTGQSMQSIQILKTDGNDRLGGADWDNRLYEEMLRRFCDENGLGADEIRGDLDLMVEIRGKIEALKRKLSLSESASVKIKYDGQRTTIDITREEFESITADLLRQTITLTEGVLKKAKLTPGDITTLLLVGGSTRMPMVRSALESMFPGKIRIEDPDLSVAKGAAIYASMLVSEEVLSDTDPSPRTTPKPATRTPSKMELSDVSPSSFGPMVLINPQTGEMRINNLIFVGTALPLTVEKIYGTAADNQQSITIRVFENTLDGEYLEPLKEGDDGQPLPNQPNMSNIRELGNLNMLLPPGTSKGSPIRVQLTMDNGGTLHALAENIITAETVDTNISTIYSTTPEEDAEIQERLRKMNVLSDGK